MGADDILASEPEITGGHYTGGITTPMISHGKADAVQAHAARLGYDLDSCHAYGDDASDEPFMERTGHPVVVGHPKESFATKSSQLGWHLIPVT
ncbi:HAD family hydrolase [Arthrobacter sp. A5]|uniref:HAD family hydrolase n=1 Tax=Arthrobacter sp. A5 TaxID=576926 RepID=UPI003DA9AA62